MEGLPNTVQPTQLRPDELPFIAALSAHGNRPALIQNGRSTSYAELDALADAAAARLAGPRALVVLGIANTVESVVHYLGALRAGHPVLLVDAARPASAAALAARFRAGYLLGPDGSVDRSPTPADVHPELALLLSTSGSTGSARLVRLSYENLRANTATICAYLPIEPDSCAALSLPLSYCYGLSVLHTHLAVGAAVLLTSRSVTEPAFWDEFASARATSLAGVPYTFDLLDRVEFDTYDLPSLRYVTQAGGRLSPDAVRRFAQLGASRGWDFYVMYGQTEATARMAYLPPHFATEHPDAVGIPVEGGSFSVDSDTGELEFRGPNVMLGYADAATDLAIGRTVDALRTGDLGEIGTDGLVRITGRAGRFAKLFGLRIDLDRTEAALAADGIAAWCASDDRCLVVAHADEVEEARVRRSVTAATTLPPSAIRVERLAELPRLANGKPDRIAILAAAENGAGASSAASIAPARTRSVADIYATVLGRTDVSPSETFVSLGGDSLSHVEASLRLEDLLGHLPSDWPTIPVADLETTAAPSRRARNGWVHLETTVLLRALAILFVLAAHLQLWGKGGGHTLLVIAGYSFARFPLAAAVAADTVRPIWQSLLRVAVPSVLVIGAYLVLFSGYGWPTALLVNSYFGPATAGSPGWQFWFVEAVVQDVLVLLLVLAVPAVRRFAVRRPFELAMAFVTLGLLVRWDVLNVDGLASEVYRPHTTFWVFALGWGAHAAAKRWQRALVTVLAVSAFGGFFAGDRVRELAVVTGFCALVWIGQVAVPRLLARAAATVAAASLCIFLTHWAVLRLLDGALPRLLLFGVCVLVGLAATAVARTLIRLMFREGRSPRR